MVKGQYFLMPLIFLQECEDSTGFHWNLLEWDWNGTRIHRNEIRFHRNYCIPAGIELESAGMALFMQEWNILNKIVYIYGLYYICIY